MAEQYVTWDNGKIHHEELFTSIFKDPITNEAFLAGPWSDTAGEGNAELPDKNGLYWFRKKIKAEHAAAARALDCLLLRAGSYLDSCCYGESKLYWPSQKPTLTLNEIPAHILERLQNLGMSFDDQEARLACDIQDNDSNTISVPTKKEKIEKEKLENNNKDDDDDTPFFGRLSRNVIDKDDKDYYYIPYEG